MSYRDHKTSERQITRFASRVMRRIGKAGSGTFSQEDIEQELWIAWCTSVEKYDPERGVPFAPYLDRMMKLHINRIINVQIERFQGYTWALSLDTPASDEDDMTLADAIADDTQESAIEGILRNEGFNRVAATLSENARMVVSILRDAPAEIMQEVEKADAKAEYAKQLGVRTFVSRGLTLNAIFNLMDTSRFERVQITKEIKTAIRKVHGYAA